MIEDVFHKILSNTADEDEKISFFSSLENDTEKKEEFYNYKNLYFLSSLKADNYRQQQHESFIRFWNTVQPEKSQKTLKWWMKYAAVFIIALVLGISAHSLLSRNKSGMLVQHTEYSSEKGSVSTIRLDDGSAIWLSSGTNLILDKNKNGEITARLDGEAYFDLTPNSNRKFIVDFGQFKIRDIGTQFNIRAYQTEQTISTALVEGKIDMMNNSGKSFLTVNPGELVRYNKTTNEITVNQQDPSIVTAWKEGKFVFIDKTLADICSELENWYNIEIQIDDKKLAETRYTSVVKRSTTVQMVLKILAVTDQIHYEITEKKEGKDLIKISK